MGFIMLGVEFCGPVEGLDRLLRLAESHQRGGPVVVSRDEGWVAFQRLLEVADGVPMAALRGDGHAEVVLSRRDRPGTIARAAR